MKGSGIRLIGFLCSGVLSLALSGMFALASFAVEVSEVPNPRVVYGGWVTDMANLLSPETETQLNQLIFQLEAQNGTEIAVVTVPETAPSPSPKAFATALFNEWGVGKEEADNGVLFLISHSDRRVEIEVGYGLEATLPDTRVGGIIETAIVPQFKRGEFDGGTLAGTRELVAILQSEGSIVALDSEGDRNSRFPWGWIALGGGLTTVAAVSLGLYARRRRFQSFLKPQGRSHRKPGRDVFFCADCKTPMKAVDRTTLEAALSDAERRAETLKFIEFKGWQCPNCSPHLSDLKFHIVGYQFVPSHFSFCPSCRKYTMTFTMRNIKNKKFFDYTCLCCGHSEKKEIKLSLASRYKPSKRQKSRPRIPWTNFGDSGGGDYSGGGGYSSGGESFGGGDSGGGGAGGDW
ncbi:TPM domain-containing protein [Baaleninema sp.]|uniref:TPM domain-containing protein n=1 Tax=Baaleninema sp. TaxID=3101197 RepID=UPI003D07F410